MQRPIPGSTLRTGGFWGPNLTARACGAIAIAVLLLAVALPLVELFYRSLIRDGALSLGNYFDVFSVRRNYQSIWDTLALGFWSMIVAAALGVPLAWLVARTDLPGRRFLEIVCLLPYMLPPLIGAMAWTQLLAPRAGYINRLWMSLMGTRTPLFNIYSFDGMVIVMGFYTFPFVFLAVCGALERMNPSLEEAARICGARSARVARDITVPLVIPSIAAGMMLAFLYAASNFGIPALLGMRARIFVLSTRIYAYVLQGDMAGIQLATSLSVVLLALAGLLILGNRWILRRQHGAAIISGKSVRPTRVELGRFRYPLAAVVHLFMALTTMLPIVALFSTSFLKAWGLPLQASNLTLRNYQYILFEFPLTRTAILNSLILAVASATAAVLLGAVFAYIVVKAKVRGRQAVDALVTFPRAIPGTVLALGMILAWSGRYGVNLYGTLTILFIAYLAYYTFYAYRNIAASLVQVHPSMEEAARISGAGLFQTLRDVVFPLIRPGLTAGWLLVFAPTLRELTISVLLYGPFTPTIGVALFDLQDAGYFHIASALAAVLVVVILVTNMVMRKIVGARTTAA